MISHRTEKGVSDSKKPEVGELGGRKAGVIIKGNLKALWGQRWSASWLMAHG